jgi:hypothetical protein
MRDEPYGAALIDAARRALTEEVVPGLTGRPRYVALMVANALGIAMREIAEAEALAQAAARVVCGQPDLDDPLAALTRAIRRGERDAEAGLHAALTEAVEVAARVGKKA